MRRVPAAEPANCCFCQDALDPMLYHAYVDEGAECCQRCDYEKCIMPRLRGGGLQPHTLLKSMRLLEACETGSAADVQALLPPTPDGRVAFFRELMKHDKGNLVAKSCELHRYEIASALVALNFPLDALNADGRAAVHYVSSAAFVLQQPLANARLLDARGKSALHYACEAGNAELVRLLLSKGLDLRAVDGTGNTCAHFAGPHAGLLLWLVHEQGALPDAPNAEGQTPLFPAAASGRADAALALLNLCGARLGARDARGRTPLHLACASDCPAVVAALLGEGAAMDAKDVDGKTPQQLAGPGAVAAVVRHKKLERLGGRVLERAARWDHEGLRSAMRELVSEFLKPWQFSELLRLGERTHWTAPRHPVDMFRDAQGRTALAVAAATGIFRNAELLVQTGASPLEVDCTGRTPAQLALARGSDCMATWFQPMPIVYWAGLSQLRYRPAAALFLLCCRFSRRRERMHPDDWHGHPF